MPQTTRCAVTSAFSLKTFLSLKPIQYPDMGRPSTDARQPSCYATSHHHHFPVDTVAASNPSPNPKQGVGPEEVKI